MSEKLNDTFGKQSFNLSKYPDDKFYLSDFNIDVLCDLEEEYGSINEMMSKLNEIAKSLKASEISNLLYKVVDDPVKDKFPTLKEFRRAIMINDLTPMVIAFTNGLNGSLPTVKEADKKKQTKPKRR